MGFRHTGLVVIGSGIAIAALVGCSVNSQATSHSWTEGQPVRAQQVDLQKLQSLAVAPSFTNRQAVSQRPTETGDGTIPARTADASKRNPENRVASAAGQASGEALLTLNGRQYRVQLLETSDAIGAATGTAGSSDRDSGPERATPDLPDGLELPETGIVQTSLRQQLPPAPIADDAVEATGESAGMHVETFPAWEVADDSRVVRRLTLAGALAEIGPRHPAVGIAQWRVQEAYARLEQAEALWLPSIRAGLGFHQHDGQLQASDGDVLDVNRSSFQAGLGVGAVGAGTTMRPGLLAEFHVADAIFQPRIREKDSWAQGHAANATINRQLFEAASAHVRLLAAEQRLEIARETRGHVAEVSRLTADYAAAGQGLQADADRLATELLLVDSRLISEQAAVDLAAARLAATLSFDTSFKLRCVEPVIVPIDLVSPSLDQGTLVSTGLTYRPELKESQCLVVAACEAYRREKYAAFVPSVLLGMSQSGFGGGTGTTADDFGDRFDFDALVTWEVRNLGFGDRAARAATTARFEQARFQQVRMMDQIVQEVTEAVIETSSRRQQISVAEEAIRAARDSFERNSRRIRDGQGLPLEVLQSIQALDTARRNYLDVVAAYNISQFQLQWALGWPVQDTSKAAGE